jgi:hypothetical protein
MTLVYSGAGARSDARTGAHSRPRATHEGARNRGRTITCVGKLLVVAATLAASACATPGPILTENVGALRSGVTAARQQAQTSFASANELSREQAISRKIRLSDTILRQGDFPLAVPAAAAQQWEGAFGILDQYAAALQTLVDPTRSQETASAIGALGQSLNRPTINAKIPAGLTAVFQALGQALVQAHAERRATSVMRKTDPAFADVVSQMATAIGTPEQAGSLSNTVASQWNSSVLPMLENEYGQVKPSDRDARRRVVEAYVKAMAERDRQLSDLVLLQQSILALGEAHSSAAKGRPGDALFWIGRINGWADDVRSRLPNIEKEGAK